MITEVNGTVARFEMAYPTELHERYAFGPTWLARLPSFLWFLFSLGVTTIVVLAHHMSTSSSLTAWVLERVRGAGHGRQRRGVRLASQAKPAVGNWLPSRARPASGGVRLQP